MKKIIIPLLLIASLFSCGQKKELTVLNYVDCFIGTGEHGHTFPGATVPNGMVQLSPDTHLMGWDASSGYHNDDRLIYAFSHTHLSGTGIGDLGDVAILPFTNRKDTIPVATFSKKNEKASPGYYQVYLDNYKVNAELTSSERVGMHKYTYQDPNQRNMMLNLSHILQANWGHSISENSSYVIRDSSISGTLKTNGWADDHQISYCIEFSEAIEKSTIVDGELKSLQIYLQFKEAKKPLYLKVGLSPVSAEGAESNIRKEIPHWNFDQVRTEAEQKWIAKLAKIQIKTDNDTIKTNFYTALYHSYMAPNIWQDADGQYIGMDKKKYTAKSSTNYTVFSLWDTWRSFHPLMTILEPEKTKDWCDNLLQKYEEGGMLPMWPLAGNYTGTMIGYPSVSILADAISKGIYPDNQELCIDAIQNSSIYRPDMKEKYKGTRQERISSEYVKYKNALGFIPSDKIAKSVSYGVEFAYYDWCIAQILEHYGKKAEAKEYTEKSKYYQNYFDPSTKLMRGKNADGSWITPFNPKFSDHEHSDYVEGNAWQWSFGVPHAISDLIELHGGKDKFESMLDTLFLTSSEIVGENKSSDISGLIGQYAHGNEPSHMMAYLYNYTNSPIKTNLVLKHILNSFYTNNADGIIGNEDCGQMSAWYVFSSMGIYPLCPGKDEYEFGLPLFDEVVLNLDNEKQFKVIRTNGSDTNLLVKEIKLNGKTYQKKFIKHSDIMNGGTLEFIMSQPTKKESENTKEWLSNFNK